MQTVETLNEGLKRAYTLTISAKDIEARVADEIAKVAPQIRMPGFRPGKVPGNLVRKMHGPALEADALNSSIKDSVQSLVAREKLRPAMSPAVELTPGYAHGKDAEVKVELEVLPVLPTPDIDGIKLERLTVAVDDSAIEATLSELAAQQKSFEDAKPSHKARAGDLVVMDFIGRIDGEAFEGGKAEGAAIEIGSGRLIPGFEDQLIGLKANDEKQVVVTFPADYSVDYLKGKEATFDVLVNAVRTPKPAIVNDDLAKSLGLADLDQLKTLLRSNAEQELNQLTRTHMKRRLLDQLAARHSFDVPESMVDAEFEQIWKQLEQEANREADPKAALAEMEAEREEYRKIAVRRVRLGLLLSEIGQANGVEISGPEMNRLIQQAAMQYDQKDRERFVQFVQSDPMAAAQLRAPLYEDKVVDFLFARAEITDRQVTREELEAAIEADSDDDDGVKAPKAKARKPAAKKAAGAAKPEDAAEKPVRKAKPAKAEAAAGKAAAAKPAPARKATAKKA